MFTIISIMFIGIGIGYLMRNVQMLQKVEKSASLSITGSMLASLMVFHLFFKKGEKK